MAMSPAERAKRCRERKKNGGQSVRVELTGDDLESLYDAGLVGDWRRADPEELASAIREILKRHHEGVTP